MFLTRHSLVDVVTPLVAHCSFSCSLFLFGWCCYSSCCSLFLFSWHYCSTCCSLLLLDWHCCSLLFLGWCYFSSYYSLFDVLNVVVPLAILCFTFLFFLLLLAQRARRCCSFCSSLVFFCQRCYFFCYSLPFLGQHCCSSCYSLLDIVAPFAIICSTILFLLLFLAWCAWCVQCYCSLFNALNAITLFACLSTSMLCHDVVPFTIPCSLLDVATLALPVLNWYFPFSFLYMCSFLYVWEELSKFKFWG